MNGGSSQNENYEVDLDAVIQANLTPYQPVDLTN